MKNVLSVYNTCGLSGNENTNYYIRALNGLLAQFMSKHDVLISGCMVKDEVKKLLEEHFKGRMYFCWIDEVLPVNVTFNHAVREHVKRHGEYKWYFYIDSGCHFDNKGDAVAEACQIASLDDFGMLSIRTDTDSGYNFIFGTHYDDQLFNDILFYIPVGRAVNCHTQFFSNDLLKYYGKLIPDVFASYCTESVFSFVNAAINKKYAIYRDLVLTHAPMMDGQSAGFNPAKHAATKGGSYIDHPFRVESLLPIMRGGQQYGLGYEELQGVVMHDPSKYDEHGFCTDPRLKEYIKDNLFVPKHLLDYDTIKTTYVEK